MHRLIGFVKMVGIIVTCAFFALTALPVPSAAAASSCQVSPSESTCTGQDPQVTGCEADAYTIATAEVTNTVRAAVRYSPTCRSAWARAVNLTYLSGSRITAQVLRNDGRNYARAVSYPTTAITSQMVYLAPGQSAKAIATLQNSSGGIISQVQTGYAAP